MAKEIFVIGVGGTGMRCIESFIHLCSIGMFDDTDVHLLAIDTDKDNGNFTRLQELKNNYLNIKGDNRSKDTFFSANLNYYQFSPDYSEKVSFNALYNYRRVKGKVPEHADLADLVFTEKTRSLNLEKGYRSQTHLGSMLMYHSILEQSGIADTDIRQFVTQLSNGANNANKPRVFIFGSVFGGTGASSISIIPKALINAAANIGGTISIENDVFFSSILLTGYFSFDNPADDEIEMEKIIATSDKFAFNSQAAMMFYEADHTVKKTYQKLYLLGSKNLSWDVSDGGKVKIGGKEQVNDAHYIELMAAFAAHDFFNIEDEELTNKKNVSEVDYLYRTIDESGLLDFKDFSNEKFEEDFAQKLGLFVAFAAFVGLDAFNVMSQAVKKDFDNKQIQFGYDTIKQDTVDAMKKYLTMFGITDGKGNEINGWLQQVYKSTGENDKFLFNPELFSDKKMENIEFNNKLYKKGSNWSNNKFNTNILNGMFNKFKVEFIKTEQVDSPCSSAKFIKHCFDTLASLYRFN